MAEFYFVSQQFYLQNLAVELKKKTCAQYSYILAFQFAHTI